MANCILLTRDNCSQAHEDMANYGLDACPVCGQELEPAKKQAFSAPPVLGELDTVYNLRYNNTRRNK